MSGYEKPVNSIQKDVTVLEIGLHSQTSCYGLYRNGKIHIEKTLSTRQKKDTLAEEHGRYQTSVGTILDQNCTENRRWKLKARNVVLEQLIILDDLTRCSEAGLSNHHSCAEFLEVDIETLKDMVTCYQRKYGATYLHKGRISESRDYFVVVLDTGLI